MRRLLSLGRRFPQGDSALPAGRVLLALALALVPARTSAQHSLVLSGGGARGLAHAGVLVGIEQLGYAPHAVAGTSMGAIIGALYAAGYTPVEIWHTVAQEDWRALFVADPFPVGPDREPRRPLFSVAFLHGAEPVLGGFVPETGINRRLTQLLFDAGVRAGNDFDSLPRPFRAVAADLRTGEAVVLAGGDLARAARASMAVPGAFAPVRWGERVLVDGAIANNLPIRVVRTLAHAPVIAVDVVRPAGELQEVSALDIGVRAVRLLLLNARSAQEARDTAELFIAPPLPFRWSEAAFPENAGPLLTVGYEGALDQMPPTPRAAQARALPHAAPARLDSLVVEGADPSTYALVRRTFRGALGSYAPERVLERMDALYASGMFQGVWPRVERDSTTGAHLLVVRAEPTAPAVVTGAAGWDSDLGARGWAALRARARLLSPLELRGAVSADRLSTSVAGSANFYSTLLPPWALSAGGHWRENRVREFDGEDIAATARVRRAGAWIGAERRDLEPQRSIALLLRAERVSSDTLPEGASYGALLRLSALPPSDAVIGIPSMAEIEVRGGDVAYTRLHVAGDARIYAGTWRAAFVADAAYLDGTLLPVDVVPYVGGRDGASWLREGELRGRARVLGGIDVAHPFLLDGHLRLRFRGGAAAPDLDELRNVPWTLGAELGAVWNTAVGPLAAGAAIGRDNRWRLQLGIGAEW